MITFPGRAGLIAAIILFVSACQKPAGPAAPEKPVVEKPVVAKVPEKPDYSTTERLSAEERRDRTNAFLTAIKVPTLQDLPVTEDHTNARFQTAQDIARRSVILYAIIFVVHGEMTTEEARAYLQGSGLWPNVSPMERKFLASNNVPDQVRFEYSWRIESLNVLLWSLGKISTLDLPRKMCDFENVRDLPDLSVDPNAWIERAALRNVEDILNESDFIYRLHWAVRDGELKKHAVPGNFHPGIIFERHYALNWLVRYADHWDDVTTDT
jgi:hypothetical protein